MQECRICAVPPGERLVSRPEAFAFRSLEPVATGHLVVAVAVHRTALEELTPEEAAGLFRLIRDVAEAAKPALDIEKFYLAAIADVDRHFHVHLLPKEAGAPPLGRFLFGEGGWGASLSSREAKPDPDLIERLRRL